MAKDTQVSDRNLVIYEVYVRNHGANGSFSDVEADLERIRGMGVDVIWFMPIHPIGKVGRKGVLGSPYSITDYRGVNPEYGSMSEFARLVEIAHSLGLKVWIDVVFNHTAIDSVLVQEHPAWFHQDENGTPVTTVPDWSDVIDLKHPNPDLSTYLIKTLQNWAAFGVDGFRCDVAALIPIEFWAQARDEVAQVNPKIVWLAESVETGFIEQRHYNGLIAQSDSQLYQAFDITYDYDIWSIFNAAVRGEVPLSSYLEMLRFQGAIYPANYIKLRCVENHDTLRIMQLAPSHEQARAWTAFEAFNKGAFLIYAGQESGTNHRPTLFDIDKIEWGGYPLQPFLTTLANLKKDPAMLSGEFVIMEAGPLIQATWYLEGSSLYGIFNPNRETGQVPVHLPDGIYTDLLSGQDVTISNSEIDAPESAWIFRYTQPIDLELFYSYLMDYRPGVD